MHRADGRRYALVACLGSLTLAGCQIQGPVATSTTASEPAQTPAAPAPVIVEAEPKTITVVRTETSPTVTELALFEKAALDDRKAMLNSLQAEYKQNATAENALRYGAALAIATLQLDALKRAESLLQDAAEGDTTGIAGVMLDQTRKRLTLMTEKAAVSREKASPPKPAVDQTTTNQLAEQNRTINRLQLDNAQLRSALTEAEAKIRELAQIETELAKPKKKTSP